MNAKKKFLLLVPILLAAATPSWAQYTHTPTTPAIIKFSTMVGVNGAFLGPNEVRGVAGDTLPWIVAHVNGTLLANGRLTVKVKGLIFPVDAAVPPQLQGTNDEPTFRAIVSCMSDDGQGGLTTVNVPTPEFPATTSGNANIVTTVQLPNPCVAPIVFIVAGSSDRWFAMTGVRKVGI